MKMKKKTHNFVFVAQLLLSFGALLVACGPVGGDFGDENSGGRAETGGTAFGGETACKRRVSAAVPKFAADLTTVVNQVAGLEIGSISCELVGSLQWVETADNDAGEYGGSYASMAACTATGLESSEFSLLGAVNPYDILTRLSMLGSPRWMPYDFDLNLTMEISFAEDDGEAFFETFIWSPEC